MTYLIVFILGAPFGAILPAYIYMFRTPKSRRRAFARLIDDMLRVAAASTEQTNTPGWRVRTLTPIAVRANLASGLQILELAAGVIRAVASNTEDDDGEIDPVRWAWVREQIEARLLLTDRPEVSDD